MGNKAKNRKKEELKIEQSTQALFRNGVKYFEASNYADAIEVWERANKKLSTPQLKEALTETYFRQGVVNNDEQSLLRSAELAPQDARVHYYLGRFYAQTDLVAAERYYQRTIELGGEFGKKAAYQLVIARYKFKGNIEEDNRWNLFSEEQRQILAIVSGIQAKAKSVDSTLYQALIAYQKKQFEQAQQLFESLLSHSDENEKLFGFIHFCLGNIAAQNKNLNVALEHWQKADQCHFRSKNLFLNLAHLYRYLAEDAIAQKKSDHALLLIKEAMRLQPNLKEIIELNGYLNEWRGYDAALKQDWKKAISCWNSVKESGESNFRLAYNLALAYEKDEQFEQAGELWREAIRRRPRKEDHPDSLSAEKVAQLWQRSAEAYVKAGQTETALGVYLNAIKYDDQNISLRLAYTDALLDEGRFEMAENELTRLVEIAPKNIPVLLKLGELFVNTQNVWQKINVWPYERILEIDPNHTQAKELLVEAYLKKVENSFFKEEIIECLELALNYAPENVDVLLRLAGVHSDSPENGMIWLNRAHALLGDDLKNHVSFILTCLILTLLEMADTHYQICLQKLNSKTKLNLIKITLEEKKWNALGEQWLEQLFATDATEELYEELGDIMLDTAPQLVMSYMEKGVALFPYSGWLHAHLGKAHANLGNLTQAKHHWKEARKRNKSMRDDILAHYLDMMEWKFMKTDKNISPFFPFPPFF